MVGWVHGAPQAKVVRRANDGQHPLCRLHIRDNCLALIFVLLRRSTTYAMSSLQDLPTELLEYVLDELCVADISHLCRTSRSFHRACIPYLFRSISWGIENSDEISRWEELGLKTRKIVNIAKLLRESPQLASHVKHLDLYMGRLLNTPEQDWDPSWEIMSRGLNPELEKDIDQQLELSGLEVTNEDTEEWTYLEVDVLMALTISKLTGLQSPKLNASVLKYSSTMRGLLIPNIPQIQQPPQLLQLPLGLCSLVITDDRRKSICADLKDHSFLPFETFISLLALPRLRHLDASPRTSWLAGVPKKTWFTDMPVSHGLRSLCLRDFRAPDHVIQCILEHCPQLQSLELEIDTRTSISLVNFQKIREGLDIAASTLEHLNISASSRRVDYAPMLYSLGSLVAFAQLTRLTTPLAFLYGETPPAVAFPLGAMLPPRLRRLTITDEVWPFSEIRHWVGPPAMAMVKSYLSPGDGQKSDWQAATPELEKFALHLNGRHSPHHIHRDSLAELQQICRDQGLVFDVEIASEVIGS